MTSILMLFPHSSPSLILADSLLREGYSLFLYSPSKFHKQLAHTLSIDLKLAALGSEATVTDVNDENLAEVSKMMDVVVVPSIDLLPEKERSEFAKMCSVSFR